MLSSSEGEIIVESRIFLILENAGIPEEDADPSGADTGIFDLIAEIGYPGDDVVVTGGAGGLILWSAGNDHYPRVRIEQWSDRPLRSGQEWEAVQEVVFSLRDTGELVLTAMSGGASEDASPVVFPHAGDCRARVHVRGRQEARCRGEAEFYHGVEHWLVQIWPR